MPSNRLKASMGEKECSVTSRTDSLLAIFDGHFMAGKTEAGETPDYWRCSATCTRAYKERRGGRSVVSYITCKATK